MKDLQNRVVVITGAGSGIGRATALRFAREGARLHLVDIDEAAVEAARGEALAVGAPAVEAHVANCADAAAVEALAAAVVAAEGRVDVLHNNAGVCFIGPMEQQSLADWKWLLDVDLWGVINGIHAFLPQMIRQGGGHIVNTASMAGLMGLPMVAAYSTAKHAVVGLSESLNIELGVHGIRVTAICPGSVRTNVMRNARFSLGGGAREGMIRSLGFTPTTPDHVARQVVDAVKRDRGLVAALNDMTAMLVVKRLSTWAYQEGARALTTWARLRWPAGRVEGQRRGARRGRHRDFDEKSRRSSSTRRLSDSTHAGPVRSPIQSETCSRFDCASATSPWSQ
jgi:NAD(P)-dependent dehydrogenase (short-subunit alcohol dehydrogenase family)